MAFDHNNLQNEGTWRDIRGRIREQWGDLTDDDVDQARGNWDQFVGTLKKKTGDTIETIQRKSDDWTSQADASYVNSYPEF